MRRLGPPAPPPPAPKKYSFKSRIPKRGRLAAPPGVLRYREPPLSGLVLAGVGDPEPKRLRKFYHTTYDRPYGAMNRAFHLINNPQVMRKVQAVRWDTRRALGPLARKKRWIDDPQATAEEVKRYARARGATQVGCCRVTEEAIYEGAADVPRHAIVVAAPMDRAEMLDLPTNRTGEVIIDGYLDVGRAANDLAERLRSWGWHAETDTNLGCAPSKLMHIPLAVAAGLGTMGRHTSLITREHGANVRLATVLTDLPLAFDAPVDFGV